MIDKRCVIQDDTKDCGISCLLSIIRYYNGDISKEYLKEITNTNKDGVSAYNLIKSARELGFESYGIKCRINDLNNIPLPLIGHVIINKKYPHFVTIYKISFKKETIVAMDPSKGMVNYSFNEWNKISSGYYLVFKPRKEIPKLKNNINIFNILFGYLNKFKKVFFIILFMSFIYALINIILSYNVKILIDELDITNNNDLHFIFFILLYFILFNTFTYFFRNKLFSYIGYSFEKNIMNDSLNHIINLPYLYYTNHTTGDILTRINDLQTIKNLFCSFIITIFIDLFFAIIIFIIMFKLEIKLSFISIIICLLYFGVSILENYILLPKIRESKINSSNINNILVENLISFQTIKGLSIQDRKMDYFNQEYYKNNLVNKKITNILNRFSSIKSFIIESGFLIITFIGVIMIKNNQFSITSLITFIGLLRYVIDPLKNISNFQIEYQNAKISIQRIKDIYLIPSEKLSFDSKRKINDLNGNITFENVSYSYNDVDKVIDNVSFNINDSEKVLIYGSSGSGKSTLMKILVNYLNQNYSGKIYIGKYLLKDICLSDIRNNFVYISQDEHLFNGSIYENVTLGRKISYKYFLNLMKKICIDEIVSKSEMKYDFLLEDDGGNLSGGERQRIIIARSILKRANVYIFDESFCALDTDKERIILNNIFRILCGKTIIVISHRKTNEDLFDKKIDIMKGKYITCD